MPPRWRYVLAESFTGLVRNPLVTLALVLSAAVSLSLLGGTLLLQREVRLISGEIQDNIEISIFLCDGRKCPDITDEQLNSIDQALGEDPLVLDHRYESKQQAYENFIEIFAESPDLIDSVTVDAVPASFRVTLKDPEQYRAITDRFSTQPGVEEVVDGNYLEPLFDVIGGIQLVALIITLVQITVTVLLTSIIIRLSMFARREAISIMRLVGASNWYVRTPFLLEGVIAGLVGGALALGMLVSLMALGRSWLLQNFSLFPLVNLDDALAVGLQVLPVGVAIVVLASLISLLVQEHADPGR